MKEDKNTPVTTYVTHVAQVCVVSIKKLCDAQLCGYVLKT